MEVQFCCIDLSIQNMIIIHVKSLYAQINTTKLYFHPYLYAEATNYP